MRKQYMEKNPFKPNFSVFIISGLAVVAFSLFVFELFSSTIPNVVISFFKEAGVVILVFAIFVFAFSWMIKARPHNIPKKYSVVIFDVYGREIQLDNIRTDFKTHDVAWSFMRKYKIEYPLNNFALVADSSKSQKRTIFKYI